MGCAVAAGREPTSLLDLTIKLWSSRGVAVPGPDEASELVRTVAGFFQVLADWQGEENVSDAAKPGPDAARPGESDDA
jgi:hypothetical protein